VSDDALEYAQTAVGCALRAGATEAEATVFVSERFSAEARDRTITKLEQSAGRSLQLRLFADGRKAAITISGFDPARLQNAAERGIAQARHVARDPLAGLPANCGRCPQADALELYSGDVPARPVQSKLGEALALERRVRDLDPRVTNSNGSHVNDTIGTTAIANSNGFAGSYRSTRLGRSSSPVAEDGGVKRTGAYGTAARRPEDMEGEESVARFAVDRTVGLFGARKPLTMRVPVIFERDAAAAVLADLFAALNAANVAIGNSWIAERIGERIGSGLVNIVDDGTMPWRLGSAPFDGEGVPTQHTRVFEDGILRTLLYDTYYARKLGAVSTGNSTGGGIGPNNFYLQPGMEPLEDLVGRTSRGVLVMETIGFASEHASGTYSRGARGYFIENGAIAYPVEEFTIAGTFPEMLAGLDALCSDLRFDAPVVSPSFRIAEMTVSGD
jgi:PmbA protein